MSYGQTNFMKRVLADIARYQDRRTLVRTNLIERLIVRHLDPADMHPNPEDEFSDPDIGPNNEIIAHYVELIRSSQRTADPIFEEPISVERMKPEGYMILNGHHRWAAAVQTGQKRVRAHIVNPRNMEYAEKHGKV